MEKENRTVKVYFKVSDDEFESIIGNTNTVLRLGYFKCVSCRKQDKLFYTNIKGNENYIFTMTTRFVRGWIFISQKFAK